MARRYRSGAGLPRTPSDAEAMAPKQLRRPAWSSTIAISGSSAPDAIATGTRSANILMHAAAPGKRTDWFGSISSTIRDFAAIQLSILSGVDCNAAILRQRLKQPCIVVPEIARVVILFVELDAVRLQNRLVCAQVQRLAICDDSVKIKKYGLEHYGRRSPARMGNGRRLSRG